MQHMLAGAVSASATSFLLSGAFAVVASPLMQPAQIPLMMKMVRYSSAVTAVIGGTNSFWMPEWHPKPIANSAINGSLVGGFFAAFVNLYLAANIIGEM